MTIATELRRAGPYAGNGVTVAFPFNFKVFAAGDVLVVRTDATGDNELALTTDYGVTLNGSQDAQPGGSVSLLAPLAAGAQLTILSRVAALQPTELTNQGGFYPQVITRALDRATILIQQLAERVGRSLVLSPTEGSVNIPAPGLRRGGKILGFNRDTGAFEVQGGDAFIGAPGASDNTYVSLSAFKASDIGRKTASLVGASGVPDGRFNWTAGNFSGQVDDVDVVASADVAVTAGAWVRQGTILPNTIADGRDNSALIQAIFNLGGMPAERTQPYVLTKTIVVPAGVKEIPAGVRFRWVGPNTNGFGDLIPVFRLQSNTVFKHLCGGRINPLVRCNTDQHMVYAVAGYGVSDVEVHDVYGERCNHLTFEAAGSGTSAGPVAYANIVTPRMKAAGDARAMNVNQRIYVYGGGCRFDTNGVSNFAGASILWAFDWCVDGARYDNAGHGVVALGGDANTDRDGILSNERKNLNGVARNITANGSAVTGVFGTMCEVMLIEGCRVTNCGDVGIDFEGCTRCIARDTWAIECFNGCFTTYFLNREVMFEKCHALTYTKSKPLLKIWNVTNSVDNRDVRWVGGSLECTDTSGPGVILYDSVRNFAMIGADIINARIAESALNYNQVQIEDNTFHLPIAVPANTILVGHSGSIADGTRSRYSLRRNKFITQVVQPTGVHLAIINVSDSNNAGLVFIEHNDAEIPLSDSTYAGYRINADGTTPGIGSRAWITGNRGDGGIVSGNRGKGAPNVTIFARDNRNTMDTDTPVTVV